MRSVPPVLRRTGAGDRVCVTSFSERRVRAARRLLGPQVCTGLGVGGVLGLLAAGAVHLPWRGAAAVLQVPGCCGTGAPCPRRWCASGHRHGLAVHVWTVDDPDEMDAALDRGVDGIMTDRPAVLKQVLLRRGQWSPPG